MNKIGRVVAAVLLSSGLLCAALALLPAKAETQPYLKSAHINDFPKVETTSATASAQKGQEFWIVTNEIKSPAKDNVPEMEAYRWDPGFLVVNKGLPVTLHFYGVKGKEHPFVIEGLGVKGDLKKGQVTTVTFTPQQTGTFKIVCLVHQTLEQHGPMIGYLRVE